MTSRNAPLPSLNLTPPPHSAPGTRKAGKGKKSAFSLDNYLASTQPQASQPSRLATAVSLTPQDGFAYNEGVDQPALSPAEALLCGNDGMLAPLTASSAALLSASASASPPPPPSVFGYASGSWRSRLLQCETQLRELVAHGVHEPPSLDRMLQVIELFDHVSGEMEAQQGGAFLGTLLRLFRVEFCRAVFLDGESPAEATNTASGAAAPLAPPPGTHKGNGQVARTRQAMEDGLPHTYFDEVASLQRTKAALTSSLANGASGEALLLLERQVEDKEEQLTWYRGELERVRTQYEQVADECVGLRRTLETQQRESAAQQRRLQQEIQTLHVENKDLQIQLFRLRKQISGGMAGLLKDSYQQLKLKKIGLTQRLFNEGDERIALLVFLSQVEGRLNEILDSYDNDFNLTPENSRQELQLKMAQTVTLLLEDMHYSEASYRRLVGAHNVRVADKSRSANASSASRSNGGGGGNRSSGTASALQPIPVQLVHTGNTEEAPDESDGYVAILFDPKIYEQFQARHAVQGRLQQYKKEREEAAAAARSRPREDKDAPPFNGSGNSVMVTPMPTKTLTRRETLSNLLSGIFVGDAPTGVRARFGQGEMQPEGDMQVSANSVAGSAHEDRRKKWSLDSGAISGGFSPASPSAGPSAPLTPQRVPHAPWQRFPAAGSTAGRSSSATHQQQQQEPQHPPQQTGDAVAASAAAAPTTTTVVAVGPQETLEDVVERQRAAWVAEILGPASSTVAFTVPGRHPERGDLVVVQERPAEVVPAELMMRRVLHHPMEDLCTERFLSTVEVFTGDNPAQQRLLCRVNHIDPAVPIRIPESTNFVKVKYALTENATVPAAVTTAAAAAAASAGATTTPAAGFVDEAAPPTAIFRGNPQLRLFKELGNKALVEGNLGLQYCAGAVNSTTASTVAYQRLHPMSPNRAPEWLLYQQLFGPYRSLAPRMMEVTTIDHVMACAAERYFTRMEYRYDECYLRAAGQCANFQLRRDMTERLFKDMHALSDFQEALVDELEARYGFPELVAKILYEMLCYLNAVSEKDTVLSAYLDVIRGFAAPTEIHFMAYMLYHLSYCWPESNPSTAVPVADVRTVLEYLYRNASPIMPIRTGVILSDYDMATRSAPLNFVNFRQFIASTMAHQEESVLLHLHGLFHAYTQRAMVDEAGWDTYEAVIGKLWHQKDERRSLVRYLTSCLGVNRSSSPTLPQLTLLAASAWSSNLWE